MKTTIPALLAIASALSLTPLASAQDQVSTTVAPAGTTTVSTTTTNTAGTVSEFGTDALVIRSETSPEPIRYRFSKTVSYVDETGAPVSVETIKSGLPVTVYYTREGDQMVASRVVVRKTVAANTIAPTVVERNTTTTVTKPPVVVEKPVYIDRVVEKPVVVEKKVIVDRPVAVEKATPVPAPEVVEKKTTTTTTTTDK